jgi:hypothetical protein
MACDDASHLPNYDFSSLTGLISAIRCRQSRCRDVIERVELLLLSMRFQLVEVEAPSSARRKLPGSRASRFHHSTGLLALRD